MSRRWILSLVLIAAGAMLTLAPAAAAAPGAVLWQHTRDLPPAQTVGAVLVATAPTGDVFLAYSFASGVAGADWSVTRYSAAGTRKWTRVYAGPGGDDRLTGIATDVTGSVVLCGASEAAPGDSRFTVVKWSRSGSRLWTKRLPSQVAAADDTAADLLTDARGNIYAAGAARRAASGLDWLTVKLGPGGKLLWQRRYNRAGAGDDAARALARDELGRIYVAGYRADGTATTDACVIRYTAGGHRDWVFAWGHAGLTSDAALDVAVSAGGLAVTVELTDPLLADQGVLIKLRRSGTRGWRRVLGTADGILESRLEAAGIDDAGRVTAVGTVKTMEAEGFDFAVRRYAAGGALLAAEQFAGDKMVEDAAAALAVSPAGSVYVTGAVASMATGLDVRTVAWDRTWSQIFLRAYDDAAHGDDEGHSLALAAGAVYVAGLSGGDPWLVKYAR